MKSMNPWLRRSLISLASLLIVVLILLYAAPGIAVRVATNWYEKQGDGYQFRVGHWRFAPFTTRLQLRDIHLTHPGSGTGDSRLAQLELALNPWDLFRHRVTVERVLVDGLTLQADYTDQPAAQLTVAGLTLPLGPAAETPPPEETTADTGSGEPWVISVGSIMLNNEQLSWTQTAVDVQTRGSLHIGSISAGGLDTAVAPQLDLTVQISLTAFSLSGSQTMTLQQPLQLAAKGKLVQLLTDPQWQGELTLNSLDISAPGVADAAFTSLNLTDMIATAGQQSIGRIDLSGLAVQAPQVPALTLEELALSGVYNHGQEQGVNRLSLSGLQAGSGDAALLTLQKYEVNDIAFNGAELDVGMQQYQGLVARLLRNQQGVLAGLPATGGAPVAEGPAPEDKPAAAASAGLNLLIALAGLAQADATEGKAQGEIVIRDQSVTPALSTTLQIQELRVSAIHPSLAGSEVSLQQPVTVYLLAGLDTYNRIELNAALSLYLYRGSLFPQGTIKLKIRQLDLVPFNGYTAQAIGYHLERGMLDLDADIGINQAKLSGEVSILLRNSHFVPADEETIERVSKQISMPVDTALGLLRDDNGNVKLKIPVSGDLTNPDVGLGDLTRQLSKLALQQGAMYYLKQTLQPYGLFISLASYAGDYLMAVRLDALEYTTGTTELTEDHQQNLQKVAGLMKKKDDLELQVCPFVSAEEASALGDAWPELAKSRSTVVKAWLAEKTDQDGHSLAPRITVCQPQKGDKAEVVLGVN